MVIEKDAVRLNIQKEHRPSSFSSLTFFSPPGDALPGFCLSVAFTTLGKVPPVSTDKAASRFFNAGAPDGGGSRSESGSALANEKLGVREVA